MKRSLKCFNSRYKWEDDRISTLEDRTTEITWSEEQKKRKIQRNKQSLRDLWTLWTATKYANIHIIGANN